MLLLREIVVYRIAAKWDMVADYLEYELEFKHLIDEQCNHDPMNCCVKLLENWLTSNKGVSPKTWSKLIETLRKIGPLTAATEDIVDDLKEKEIDV